MTKLYSLSHELTSAIERVYEKYFGQKLSQQTSLIADCVLQMSDFYIDNPSLATPWSETWVQRAQLAYYLPLNFLRAQRVIDKTPSDFFKTPELIELGSGLGAASLSLLLNKQVTSAHFVENHVIAQRMHQMLLEELGLKGQNYSWSEEVPNSRKASLGLASYSVTELSQAPPWFFELESLIIIEPSTRDDGRQLLEARQKFIDKNFYMWAPCLHQLACPLLNQSKTDWCHDRLHTELPSWLIEVEALLPFKNPTLTLSYLVCSKQKPKTYPSTLARVVGDELAEKGKTRYLICQNDQRLYLSWLNRHKIDLEFKRGDLIDISQDAQKVANEFRIQSASQAKS